MSRRNTAETLSATMKVLAEPTRLQIISLLAGRRGGETWSWLIAGLGLGRRPSNLTFHLRKLEEVGLVRRRPSAPHVYYELSTEAVEQVAAAIGRLR